jgi:ribosomal protein S18 acetylase RimI-like enzyme
MIIRKMLECDIEGKGLVHYQSWNETYTGLINQSYLDKRSLARCIEIARLHPENTYVAIIDDKVVGFSSCMKARDEDRDQAGEISAIYVIKAFQGLGIGKALMDVAIRELSEFNQIVVWVLSTNIQAIEFYESYGFIRDGKQKEVVVSQDTILHEIRLCYNNKEGIHV